MTNDARQSFDRLYGHLNLSAEDAAWHVFKSGWEAREQTDRQALQAAGTHPAPCARHCEANAFEIAARGMRRQITELQAALAEQPAQQEPDPDELTIAYLNGIDTGKKRKAWVGLTDEERHACTQSPFTADNYLAIEAKLKEKNTKGGA